MAQHERMVAVLSLLTTYGRSTPFRDLFRGLSRSRAAYSSFDLSHPFALLKIIAVYLDYEREPPQSRITTQFNRATAVPLKRFIFVILTGFGIEISSLESLRIKSTERLCAILPNSTRNFATRTD